MSTFQPKRCRAGFKFCSTRPQRAQYKAVFLSLRSVTISQNYMRCSTNRCLITKLQSPVHKTVRGTSVRIPITIGLDS